MLLDVNLHGDSEDDLVRKDSTVQYRPAAIANAPFIQGSEGHGVEN